MERFFVSHFEFLSMLFGNLKQQFTKKFMLARDETLKEVEPAQSKKDQNDRSARLLQRMAMEVAADDDQPFPAPYPKKRDWWANRNKWSQGRVIVQ